MKSVCIVGAGPAGLVAAKVFLQTGEFDVTVFEKKSRIGGIWALDHDSPDGFLAPSTPTNLSRFTVGFSDLDWNSVDFQNGDEAKSTQQLGDRKHATPMFPKAWMANKYLETYRLKYIPDGIVHCSCEVQAAERQNDKWRITVKDTDENKRTLHFDWLIMASGFFAKPRSISQNIPSLPTNLDHPPVKFLHTSSFRTLRDLFPDGSPIKGKKILLIGGGNSSGEAAAAIAFQLSDACWSPDQSTRQRYQNMEIVQVLARPLYPVPPFVECDEGSRSYVPIDFKLYDLSKRPEGMQAYGGRQPTEVRNIVHSYLQTMVGGDLSDVDPALVSPPKGPERGSVYVALSESYPEYVKSGLIKLVPGRVDEIRIADNGCAVATVKHQEEQTTVDDIAAIVYATGYTPAPALDILDESTKKAIRYDSQSLRLPMILGQWQTMSKDAPAVSFLGFYEGPYWPTIEMQAKLTAERWTSGTVAPDRPHEVEEQLVELRQSMYDHGIDVPQYWHGDHLGYILDLAAQLDLKRNESGFAPREGIPSPARFLSPQTNVTEANAIMSELQQLWNDCTIDGKFVARAAFRALQGNWTIRRIIDSALPTFPSGILDGTASFHPRAPTPDASGLHFDFEYLYIESGTFTLSNGSTVTAKRRYVYRYSEARDTLSVWFLKPDNDLIVDYLFHDLTFVKPEAARQAGALVAHADHPCGKDMYWTEYKMPLKGVALRSFLVKHTVKGPNKEYVSITHYERLKKA